MKFKKLVAALSAVTMLGSLAVAVPASAKEFTYTTTVSANVVAQLRANDATYQTKHTGTTAKFIENHTADTDVEINDSTYVFAFYSFDDLELPEGATINSVTLKLYGESINGGLRNHSGIDYKIKNVNTGNIDLTSLDSIFDAAATAINNGTAPIMSTKSINGEGQKNGTEPRVTADVTGITQSEGKNGYVVYEPQGNRHLGAKAELEVNYKCDVKVARIDDSTYDTLEEAFSAAKTDDTIELLSDTKLTSRIIINKDTQKNLTINGNGNTVDNNGLLIEFPDGSGSVNMNNINITGDGNLDIKGNTTLAAEKLNVSNLSFGGAYSTIKGRLSNSTVISLKTYGKLELTGTTITNLTIENINNSKSDQPTINADLSSSITSVSIAKITNLGGNSYELFVGDYKPDLIENVPDGYEYENGTIKVKQVEPKTDDRYFSFDAEADASYNTVVVKATRGGNTQEKEKELSTTITGGSLYICIEGVPTDVTIDSITLE